MVAVAVVGASGYGGAELLRALIRHPKARVVGLGSRGHAGAPVGRVWPQLAGAPLPAFAEPEEAARDAEVVFLATPNGVAMELAPRLLAEGKRVVDLSADFRLAAERYHRWYGRAHAAPELLNEAVYGLVELHRPEIRGKRLVANPGCYVTAVSLALAPLAAAGWIEEALVAAASGVSGAGRDAEGTAFAEVNEDYRPYKPAGTHRHTVEIEQNLGRARAQGRWLSTWGEEAPFRVSFTPHLAPMTRGILATAYVRLPAELDAADVGARYAAFYDQEPFVHVSAELPRTKAVLGANRVWITPHRDKRTGWWAVFSALDNLVKGAAGQAVQNMNVMLGLEESLGLEPLGLWP